MKHLSSKSHEGPGVNELEKLKVNSNMSHVKLSKGAHLFIMKMFMSYKGSMALTTFQF